METSFSNMGLACPQNRGPSNSHFQVIIVVDSSALQCVGPSHMSVHRPKEGGIFLMKTQGLSGVLLMAVEPTLKIIFRDDRE
ncbi:hypothetical protein [Azospirillum doebereinerae]